MLNPNSYWGIKLLERAFKLYENILDGHLHEVIVTELGRGTVDVALVLRRLTEKFRVFL